MGLSIGDINEMYSVKESDFPYLQNISDDPLLSGIVMYFLEEGHSTIGSGSDQKIQMKGLFVSQAHCTISCKKINGVEVRF